MEKLIPLTSALEAEAAKQVLLPVSREQFWALRPEASVSATEAGDLFQDLLLAVREEVELMALEQREGEVWTLQVQPSVDSEREEGAEVTKGVKASKVQQVEVWVHSREQPPFAAAREASIVKVRMSSAGATEEEILFRRRTAPKGQEIFLQRGKVLTELKASTVPEKVLQ